MAKIDIIVPVYNSEKYISDCIDSILKQTFQDWRLIMVDDGSSDKTTKIIETYNDERIELYKQKHGGISKATNFGLSQATAKYIALIDNDDRMKANRLEIEYNWMESHPMTDIISGTMDYIDAKGNMIGGFDNDYILVTFDRLSKWNCISNPAAFLRRESIAHADLKLDESEEYETAQDYKFWSDALCKGLKIEILADKMTEYRKHDGQETNIKAKKQIIVADRIKKMLRNAYPLNASFITFSNSDSEFSTDRIKYEAEEMGLFENVYCYNENDFDEEYWNKYKDNYTNYKRGFGYWAWKPYFIKKTLEKCNDGDIVVYADTGCMLLKENKPEMERWMHIAASSESGILSPCYGPYIEHDWSRGDLYEYINSTYNQKGVDIFDKSIQCGAGILVVCKNGKSVDFVNQWNDIMSEHFHLCTDEQSTKPNHPNFKENRHDQSAFSMLSKIYGIETIETKYGILDKEHSPIICTRCKGDKYTWKKPIKVLYDHQTYDLQKFGGISKLYVEVSKVTDRNEIVDNFIGSGIARGEYNQVTSEFGVIGTKNAYLKELPGYEDNGATAIENRNETIKRLKEGNFDVFYPTFFDTYFLNYLNGKPFVMSIHDMIPELYPEYFSRNDMQIIGKRIMADRAALIEVPTETTKKDVVRILGTNPDKIRIIGRGIDDDFGKTIYESSPISSPYILYVGQRNAYKRFDWFVKHCASFLMNHPEVKVICTGNDFSKPEEAMLESYGIRDRFFSYFADDVMMGTLYHYAMCFVFSSEYEGFGLPILESYKCGCIALLNDNDCFREVTFGNGWYFKLSESESNLSEELEKVFCVDDTERDKILKKQYEILSHYSWKKCADKLTDMFKKVAVDSNDMLEKDDSKLDIFICSHKQFDIYPKNDIYKVIHGTEEIDVDLDEFEDYGTKLTPMEFSYAEGSRMYWLWKNYRLKDYIGICHYRKYFDFWDKVPNMDKVFENHDVVLGSPMNWGSNFAFYQNCHNINDMMLTMDIIKQKYPEYDKPFREYMLGGKMYICNMFIMKSNDYKDYCKFVFGVLEEFTKRRKWHSDLDIKRYVTLHKQEYIKNFYPNNTVEYQSRILGFVLERLTNAYIFKHFKKPYLVNIIETEDKYKMHSDK